MLLLVGGIGLTLLFLWRFFAPPLDSSPTVGALEAKYRVEVEALFAAANLGKPACTYYAKLPVLACTASISAEKLFVEALQQRNWNAKPTTDGGQRFVRGQDQVSVHCGAPSERQQCEFRIRFKGGNADA